MGPNTPNANGINGNQFDPRLQQAGFNPQQQQAVQLFSNLFSNVLNRVIQEANANANNGA